MSGAAFGRCRLRRCPSTLPTGRRCASPVCGARQGDVRGLRATACNGVRSDTWVANRTYTVPSRLIGMEVDVRQYADHLEVYYKGSPVERMDRVHGAGEAGIDYRHVIGSLVRKPGAFARYRYREQMFPTGTFRLAYDALREWRGERADVDYVRILHLAATTMESEVDRALGLLLEAGTPFDYAAVRELWRPRPRHRSLSWPCPGWWT